jgi:hypothetical protein
VSQLPHRDPVPQTRFPTTRGRVQASGQHADRAPRVGALIASSCGALGAAAVAAKHGSDVVAVTVLLAMQAWSALELVCRWRLRWRIARLQEDIARKAMEDPGNEDLRTLLADVASTHLEELGTRLPVRPKLMRPPV